MSDTNLPRGAGRRAFIASIGVAAVGAAVTPPPALAREAARPTERFASHALVLSGGGARGAFQAGLICALAKRAGVADGEPLRPYGVVCGTSIGALNAWFVATGKYAALRKAWATLASANLVELKRPYRVLTHPHRFVGERVYAAVRLALGVTKRERGVAQSEPILAWMAEHMDPRTPVLVPMVWSVTNLTTQAPEYYYRLPSSDAGPMPDSLSRALRVTLGPDVVIREASDALLHRTLLASAAVPIVFDPVALPMADGTEGMYVDGSVGSNAAVSIARTVARHVHVVLVDPPNARATYSNAVDIAMGAYATMQREILEGAMRDAYFESLVQRSLQRSPREAEVRTLARDVPPVELAYARPKSTLPADFTAFDHQAQLDETFAIGEAAASDGFTRYEWETFRI